MDRYCFCALHSLNSIRAVPVTLYLFPRIHFPPRIYYHNDAIIHSGSSTFTDKLTVDKTKIKIVVFVFRCIWFQVSLTFFLFFSFVLFCFFFWWCVNRPNRSSHNIIPYFWPVQFTHITFIFLISSSRYIITYCHLCW